MIGEVEKPKIKDLFCRKPLKNNKNGDNFATDFLLDGKLVGSGKAAIALVLKYLSERKILNNKLDEIMVPDWLGYWVYNQMQPWTFPSKNYSDRTKAIFVYHQYGFPQNMDKIMDFAQEKKLTVIEDCAHALASEYHSKPLGSFGDFSIFSFSKWFFCFALGGVKSKRADFSDYADKMIYKNSFGLTFIKDTAKFLHERSRFTNRRIFNKYADLFLNASYALYGEAIKPCQAAINLFKKKIEREIKIRRNRYRYFLQQTDNLGICNHLERERITPYVIPIRVVDSKIDNLITILRDKGFMTGRYNFDINRNLLSPQFVPVVWVPCHSGITDEIFSDLTDIIVKQLRN